MERSKQKIPVGPRQTDKSMTVQHRRVHHNGFVITGPVPFIVVERCRLRPPVLGILFIHDVSPIPSTCAFAHSLSLCCPRGMLLSLPLGLCLFSFFPGVCCNCSPWVAVSEYKWKKCSACARANKGGTNGSRLPVEAGLESSSACGFVSSTLGGIGYLLTKQGG